MMRKGYRREAGSEGSAEQRCEPMDKNRIRGASAGRAERVAKSISINDAKRRSGGCAPKAIELTPGDLPRVAIAATETAERPSDRGAEVSRGRSRPRGCSRSMWDCHATSLWPEKCRLGSEAARTARSAEHPPSLRDDAGCRKS